MLPLTGADSTGYGTYLVHQPLPYCPTDPTTMWQPKGEGQVIYRLLLLFDY